MAKKQFKAESKRLLDLMIHSIYTNRDIFLREILSNASDASDKLHYLSLTDEAARSVCGDLTIEVKADKDARTLSVTDHGVGMTKDELETNLGTICKSGSLQFKEEMSEEEEKKAVDLIGQFGVGFYSAFMVSDTVEVITRSYADETAYRWVSDGADGYTVTETDKAEVGTVIVMHLKEDTKDEQYGTYLEEYTLRRLIKTYSDYLRHPIRLWVTKTQGSGDDAKTTQEYEQINSMEPVWKKSKARLKKEESDQFYKDQFHDFTDPLLTVRVAAEGAVSYDALLFVPEKAPYDYFTKEYKRGLRLYSNGVLIMDTCEDLLSEHYRFVKGVVDSADLSLNISRETLQQDRAVAVIAKNLEKKIHGELKKALDKDRETYEKFYAAFGLQLKYGVVADYGTHKEELRDLLMFYSMKQEKCITVKEYVDAMPEDQKHIYYACGETAAKVAALPQVERLKNKGYDLLCLTDEVDEFVMNVLAEQDGKDFCSVDSDQADLTAEADTKKAEELEQANQELLTFIKDTLSISKAVVSKKLVSQPVCLTAEGGVTLEMEKYFASMPGEQGGGIKAQRVLELNGQHPLFASLQTAYGQDKEKAARMARVLYAQALLMAGLPLDDPAAYTNDICTLLAGN